MRIDLKSLFCIRLRSKAYR